MVTNDERREVAASLRDLAAEDLDDGEFYDCGEVEDALGLVTDDGSWYAADGVRRLARLIEPEERTCRDDGTGVFRCTRCGAFALLRNSRAERTCHRIMRGLKNAPGFVGGFCSECEHMINVGAAYCEHCGARVVK